MGLKRGAIGNTLGEHIGNLKGTYCEQRKMKKILPPPTQNLNEKKSRHFECMLSSPIDCMKFLFPKLFITIFGLGSYLHYKLGALISCFY
jgi:hypothetical protein